MMKRERTKIKKSKSKNDTPEWVLRLYVTGQTPNCVKAYQNLKTICEEYLKGKYQIEIIDLLENPKLAKGHQIIAIPTLVRKLPEPLRKIVGNLSDTEKVLVGLDIFHLATRD